jgi:SAM-dependent methyltransferase/glycosyltransferase involved in cell wall biosynthesis
MRLLELGCGFGRHLKYLHRLGHLDVYGCDISEPMIASVGEYLDDGTWAGEHTRVVSPDQPLPYPDRWFDMAFTCEVLIHVSPEDLDRTFAELLRVSDERLVLIENVRTQGERVDTLAHDGCWFHDFDALADRMGMPRAKVITEVIPDQHVYLFEIPARDEAAEIERLRRAIARREEEILRLKRDAVRDSNALALLRDEADLAELRTRVVELSARIAEQQQALQRSEERERGAAREAIRFDAARRRAERRSVAVEDELHKVRAELERVEDSLSRKLVRRAKRHRVAYGAARRVIDTVQTLSRRRRPEPQRSLPEPTFARIADRASLPTREEFMARAPRTVGICHPEWRGIRAATYALSDEVLEISAIRSEEHLAELAQFLADIGPRVIAIHGIMPGASSLFPALKRVLPRSRLLLAYHGSPSQENFPTENDLLEEMIDLAREKQIDALGFLKQGMAEIVRARGVSTYQLFNKIQISPGSPAPARQMGAGPQIGLFVPPVQHKNFYAQLLGALGMPSSRVHVLQPPAGSLFSRDIRRMVIHGVQPHAEFLRLLGSMDVNLYVTLSECYPMTVLESLQLGVPCVTSDTSPIFDEDAELRELLVVRKFSDPDAITRQLERVLGAREEIARRGQALLARLNERADQLWSAFAGG